MRLRSWLFFLGAVIRLAVFYCEWARIFSDNVIVTTPYTSLENVREGAFFQNSIGVSPYDHHLKGASYHPPLVLFLLSPLLPDSSPLAPPSASLASLLRVVATPLVFTMSDLLLCYLLYHMGRTLQVTDPPTDIHRCSGFSEDITSSENTDVLLSMPDLIAVGYLFNPLSIISCVSMSTSIFSCCFVVASLLFAVQGKRLSLLFLACAAYLALYPAVLVVPTICLLNRASPRQLSSFARDGFVFALAVLALLWISSFLSGSWAFLKTVYWSQLVFEDLTPNSGLTWYLFTEIFPQYKLMFAFFIQYLFVLCATTLGVRLSTRPVFMWFILILLVSTFRPHPSASDYAFWMCLVPLFAHQYHSTKRKFFIAVGLIAFAALGPLCLYLWIDRFTANANYFYPFTLVLGVVVSLCVIVDVTLYELTRNKRNQQQ